MADILRGKVAFVTGAASIEGVGRAVALRLAKEGADVVVSDGISAAGKSGAGAEDWEGLEKVIKEIDALDRKALSVVAGLENATAIGFAVKAAIDAFGKIDILVNCTDLFGTVGMTVADGDQDEWRRVFDVNALGPLIISKAVAKDMIRRNEGGKIVHVTSAAGRTGVPGSAAYVASKWAVIGLVKCLALELAPYRINVNAINPGFWPMILWDRATIRPDRKAGITVPEYLERQHNATGNGIGLNRPGITEDVARLTFFLVSPESDYITGKDIDITGNWRR